MRSADVKILVRVENRDTITGPRSPIGTCQLTRMSLRLCIGKDTKPYSGEMPHVPPRR